MTAPSEIRSPVSTLKKTRLQSVRKRTAKHGESMPKHLNLNCLLDNPKNCKPMIQRQIQLTMAGMYFFSAVVKALVENKELSRSVSRNEPKLCHDLECGSLLPLSARQPRRTALSLPAVLGWKSAASNLAD